MNEELHNELTKVAASLGVIILIGKPGAGKGTQAQRLSEMLRWPILSVGSILRTASFAVDLNSMNASLASGIIIDNEAIRDIVRNFSSQSASLNGYIADGYPRNLKQAEWFDMWCHAEGRRVLAILLVISDELALTRLDSRLQCNTCHLTVTTRLGAETCLQCGGRIESRIDDVPDIVAQRLKVFHSQTAPLKQYYAITERLIEVNGAQEPDVVAAEVYTSICNYCDQRITP